MSDSDALNRTRALLSGADNPELQRRMTALKLERDGPERDRFQREATAALDDVISDCAFTQDGGFGSPRRGITASTLKGRTPPRRPPGAAETPASGDDDERPATARGCYDQSKEFDGKRSDSDDDDDNTASEPAADAMRVEQSSLANEVQTTIAPSPADRDDVFFKRAV